MLPRATMYEYFFSIKHFFPSLLLFYSVTVRDDWISGFIIELLLLLSVHGFAAPRWTSQLIVKKQTTAILCSTTSSYPRIISKAEGLLGGRTYQRNPLFWEGGLLSIGLMGAASEVVSWNTATGLLVLFPRYQFAPTIMDLCPPHIVVSYFPSWACAAGGEYHPRSTAPCIAYDMRGASLHGWLPSPATLAQVSTNNKMYSRKRAEGARDLVLWATCKCHELSGTGKSYNYDVCRANTSSTRNNKTKEK